MKLLGKESYIKDYLSYSKMLHNYRQKESHWDNGYDCDYKDPKQIVMNCWLTINQKFKISKEHIHVLFEKYNCKDILTVLKVCNEQR